MTWYSLAPSTRVQLTRTPPGVCSTLTRSGASSLSSTSTGWTASPQPELSLQAATWYPPSGISAEGPCQLVSVVLAMAQPVWLPLSQKDSLTS